MIGRWIKRLTSVVIAVLVLAVAGGALYQTVATWRDSRQFPAPGRLLDVDGHRLHLLVEGNGGPAVIMDQVLGEGCMGWSLVQPDLAKTTTVCTYDRAGYGWSDPGALPRTSERMVTELHEALKKAAIRTPYVLAGASLGGINVQLYALRYPDEVAGLVLIDSAHEDQNARLPAEAASSGPSAAGLNILRVASRLGVLRIADMPIGIASTGALPPQLLPMARAAGFRAKVVDAIYHETVSIEQGFAALRNAKASARDPVFGNTPLLVLTHQADGPLSDEDAKAYRVWLELQAELATQSTRGRQVIVRHSGHFIALDQAGEVTSAIRGLVEEVRGG